MWFGVLGHLAVRRVDGTDVPIPGPARRQVLAALLCRPGAVVATATLVEDLWGSAPPRSAINSLRSHVVRLRAALAQGGNENLLITAGDGYRLDIAAGDVDAGQFERLVAEAGRTADARAAIGCYDAALELWRDEPYVEFGDAPFAVLERIRLSELRALARERRTDLALDAGLAGELIGDLERRVRAEPYRERGWEQLALALYRAGRQADALDMCRRVRRVLLDDLGVDPSPGLRALEQRILRQDAELLVVQPQPVATRPVVDRCPYLGLAGYEEQDAALFVGRERLTSALAGRLADQSAVVVTGASGVGKSSLVRAGLVPALRSGALPGSSSWRIDLRTPGRAVLAESERRPDLLILDQAEELFTSVEPAARDDLMLRLARYIDCEKGRLVLVLRSDFYGRLADAEALAPYAEKAAVLVGPMRADELRRALVEPADRAGLRLEDELIETIMNDVAGQPEPLPLLSEAMVRTWERRDGDLLTLTAYEQAGELVGSLEAAAEECYGRLEEIHQRAARRLLVRMAARGDTGWVRRSVPLSDSFDDAEQHALSALVAARLVIADERRVEITHDALLAHWPRLREWLDERSLAADLLEHLDQAVIDWHAAGRQDTDLYRGPRLSAATDWRVDHPGELSATENAFLDASERLADLELHSARAQTRRLRTVVIALAAVVALAVVGGVVALVERGSAQTEAQRARHAALVADARRLAALAANAPDTATASQLALAAYRLDNSQDTRAALLAAVERGTSALWRVQLPERVFGIYPTPDGSHLLVTPNAKRLWIIDTASHTRVATVPLPSTNFLGVTADDRYGVVQDHGRVSVIGIPSGEQVITLSTAARGTLGSTVTQGGQWLAVDTTANRPGRHVIDVFDLRHWAAPPRHIVTATRPRALATGRNALAIEYADGSVDVWALPALREVAHVPRTATAPTLIGLAVSPNGSLVARLGPTDKSEVTLYDTHQPGSDRIRLPPIPAVGDTFWSFAFSPDGTQFAVGSSGGPVTVYSTADGSLVDSFLGNAGQTFDVAWTASPSSSLYSVGLDGILDSWDVNSAPRLLEENGPDYLGVRAALSTSVAVNGSRRVVAFRAPSTGPPQPPLTIDLRTGAVSRGPNDVRSNDTCCTFSTVSNDGRFVLDSVPENSGVPNQSGATRNDLWDLRTNRIVWQLREPPPGSAQGLTGVMSPDGKRAYLNLTRTTIGVYALPSGKHLRTFSVHFPHTDSSLVVAPWVVDPVGRLLVSRGGNHPDNQLGLVDPASGRLLAHVQLGDIAQVMSQAWSIDKRLLAIGTFNGTLFLLDANTLTIRARVNAAEPGTIRSVSFSPDDKTLVTTGDTGELDFWTVPGLDHEVHVSIGDARVYAWYDAAGQLVGMAPDPTRPGQDMYRWFEFRSDPASVADEACKVAGGSFSRAQWQHYVGDQPYLQICP